MWADVGADKENAFIFALLIYLIIRGELLKLRTSRKYEKGA